MRSDSAQFLSARACFRWAIKSSISRWRGRLNRTASQELSRIALQQTNDAAQGFQAAGKVRIIGFVHFACR